MLKKIMSYIVSQYIRYEGVMKRDKARGRKKPMKL